MFWSATAAKSADKDYHITSFLLYSLNNATLRKAAYRQSLVAIFLLNENCNNKVEKQY